MISLPMPIQDMIEQINQEAIKTIHVQYKLPKSIYDRNNTKLTQVIIQKEFLKLSQKLGKSIKISFLDDSNLLRYEWEMDGKSLAASKVMVSDINIITSLDTHKSNKSIQKLVEKDKNNKQGLIASFNHSGRLPADTSIRIYVEDSKGYTLGKKLYVYSYNEKTKKLDELASGSSTTRVDKEGYITLRLVHCSNYVILPNKADSNVRTTLLNQINVPKSKTMKLKVSNKINVTIPPTLELANKITDITSQELLGAVTVTYASSNKKVAAINKKTGQITGKSKGTTTITTTFTLYNNKKKSYKTKLIVK